MIPDLDDVLARHRAFWRREPTDRPLLAIHRGVHLQPTEFSVRPGEALAEGATLRPEMFDPDHVARTNVGLAPPAVRERSSMVLPVVSPYPKVPWMEAILGCPIRVSPNSGSMWSEAPGVDWEHPETLRLRPDNPWLGALVAIERAFVAQADGRYAVTDTLMRGTIDLLAALVGDEEQCAAILERPAQVARMLEVCADVFIEVARIQRANRPVYWDGSVNPWGIWAPGTFARTQCDNAVLVSAVQYARHFLPHERRILASADYGLIHLHSVCLHFLDELFAVPELAAIQVSVDPLEWSDTPKLADLVPIFRRIQEHKPLIVTGDFTEAEVDDLLGQLSPRGLYIGATLISEEARRKQETGVAAG